MTDVTRPTRPDLRCDDVRELAASFVLGALDRDEADAVRAHLARCADPHVEMGELGSVLAALAEGVPIVEPRSELKARILAAAAADLEARDGATSEVGPTAGAGPAAGAVAPTPFPAAADRERRASARSRLGAWPLRIAAVLAIALLGGWNLLLQDQLGDAKTYEQNVAAVLDIAGQPGSLTAVLTGQGAHAPAGLAAVASDGSVRIAMRDLPETSGDHVYEAWVIGRDGVPRALGGFRVGPTGIAYFEGSGLPTQDGIVLALTLEPGPGATAPSSPPVSAGTAVAAG
jgi:anti-sigma-K factor RskA